MKRSRIPAFKLIRKSWYILKRPIVSVYPDRGPQRQQNLMKRAYCPFDLDLSVHENVYIMWTSTRTDMNEEYWVPNHVVPMLKMY